MADEITSLQYEYDTTKFTLYAINILLQTINELPLADDEDLAASLEGAIAQTVLEETKKAVLAAGWDVNMDDNYRFSPDQDGMIPLPANVLDISANDGDVVNRGFRLYSKSNQSHVFKDPISCTVVWDIPFNHLPHPIRYFITIKAARSFQARVIGDSSQNAFTEQDMEDAYLAARQSEGRTGSYNILTSSGLAADSIVFDG